MKLNCAALYILLSTYILRTVQFVISRQVLHAAFYTYTKIFKTMRTCFAVVVAVQWRVGTFSVYATWAGDFVIQTKIFTDNEKETH